MNTLAELETETIDQTPVLQQQPLDPESDSATRKLVNGALSQPVPPHRTAAGTPCASSWTKSWVARVTQTETRLLRRICGSRLPDGSPCEIQSHHESGRCRMHGGFDLTGAPPGNSNAEIHGLYARRLKTCSMHCPMWNECPCAGADVAAMEPVKRPTCPYEQAEYDSAVATALSNAKESDSVTPLQDAHTLALLQVMTTRASLALRNAPLADDLSIVVKGKFYSTGSKLSAHFQAFTRIVAEYRRFTAVLKPKKKNRATLTSDDMALLHLGANLIPEVPESQLSPESQLASEVPLVPEVPYVPLLTESPLNALLTDVHQVHTVHKITEPRRPQSQAANTKHQPTPPQTAHTQDPPCNLNVPTREAFPDFLALTTQPEHTPHHMPPGQFP